jgi:aromatic ring-opening dioxygenase catalytic subunit (LigB family)
MTIAFAAAIGHAPGWIAWPERASDEQRAALAQGTDRLAAALRTAKPDVLVVLTSEHWTNFFFDHISPWCVGSGEVHVGPVEPWMRMDRRPIPGQPDLAGQILEACYAGGIEPSFSQDLQFDHGTMVPLQFLTPGFDIPVVPIFFNTLAEPQPAPSRCYELGRIVGDVVRQSPLRVAIVATGGMSHDPGERGHGVIDSDFDRRFLDQMRNGDGEALRSYRIADLKAAGAGAIELIAWIALAGALGTFRGEVLAYEAVEAWATGMGIMQLQIAAGRD